MNYTELALVVLILSLIIQAIYLGYFTSRLSFHKDNKEFISKSVSVIICAKNEAENLKKNLPKIFNQKYDDFEVIVVNDRSWDNTKEILNNFKDQFTNLKIVTIPENKNDDFGKKLALTVGIKAAKNNHLILTDADCYPTSDLWIKEMSKGFKKEKQIVIGVGIYEKENGFLNKIIRYDTAQIAINFMGFAIAKVPYMGVGRNLGYTQEIYYLNNGFKSHYHISSGDDDLFVNQSSNNTNTNVVFNENSLTVSSSKKDFKSWLHQKKRHHTTNSNYKNKHKFLLLLQYFAAISFYICFLFLLTKNLYQALVLIIFFFRYIIIVCLFYNPFKIMKCKDLLLKFPLYEIILLICQPLFQINKRNSI